MQVLHKYNRQYADFHKRIHKECKRGYKRAHRPCDAQWLPMNRVENPAESTTLGGGLAPSTVKGCPYLAGDL